jgi:biotin synthase
VLQAGETPAIPTTRSPRSCAASRPRLPGLAITLSVGNRPRDVYARWRDAGMDRYLLRFETSDAASSRACIPTAPSPSASAACATCALGVQTGGGFMIGLPGETIEPSPTTSSSAANSIST